MRIDATRFGVKTGKTIRRAPTGGANVALHKAQAEALKQSQKNQLQIELVNGKLMKSAHNFEKINKKERKRQLTEQNTNAYNYQESDEEDSIY